MGDTADFLEATGFNSIEEFIDADDDAVTGWYALPIKCIWDDLPLDIKAIAKLDGFYNYFFADPLDTVYLQSELIDSPFKGYNGQCATDFKEWISEWDFENADYILGAILEMDWLHSQTKYQDRLNENN